MVGSNEWINETLLELLKFCPVPSSFIPLDYTSSHMLVLDYGGYRILTSHFPTGSQSWGGESDPMGRQYIVAADSGHECVFTMLKGQSERKINSQNLSLHRGSRISAVSLQHRWVSWPLYLGREGGGKPA